MKKIVIVKEGSWGSLTRQEYENWVDLVKRIMEGAEEVNPLTHQKEKAAEVEVVETLSDALKQLGTTDILVFVTRGMLSEARKVKRGHPRVKVVLFTGLIPDDEVILVSKRWAKPEVIRTILLY